MTAAFIITFVIACGLGLACWAQRREIERARNALEYQRGLRLWMIDPRHKKALTAIADATRNGKSGTARMVHRMAMEGLSDDQ